MIEWIEIALRWVADAADFVAALMIVISYFLGKELEPARGAAA